MSAPVLPVVIRGPGVVLIGAVPYYFTGDLTAKLSRKTFDVASDFFGPFDVRSQGGPMVDIEFTPVGMITTAQLAALFPYGPSNIIAACSVGVSIFGASPTAVTIWTKADGLKAAYARGGVYKSPTLFLSPRKTAFGSMTVRAINKISVAPTTAGAFKAITTAAFTNATFDPTTVDTDIYTATLGVRSSPYSAMGAREGFELEPTYQMDDADDVNVGVADTFVTGVAWKCRFAPNNLTEAQADAICNWDGTDAILAGQSVARGPSSVPEDLVIDADTMTATVHNVGLISATYGVGVKRDRVGMMEFAQQMVFTSGVAQPLVTLTVG